MKLSPTFRLIVILIIFLGQFISLITYLNNVIAGFTTQQQLEAQISEAQKKQKTLSSNVERDLNNQISLDRDSANLQIISTTNLTSYQAIQKNKPTPASQQNQITTGSEAVVR